MKIFLFLLLFTVSANCSCLSNLAKNSGIPEDHFTLLLVECGNMYLKGQFGYLKSDTKAKYTMQHKSEMLINYTNCEYISELKRNYLKQCERKKSNEIFYHNIGSNTAIHKK